MAIIEEYQEQNNVEANEKENTNVNSIVCVTMNDKIALGNASKLQTKLYGDRSESESQAVNESSMVAKKEDMIKKFTRFSDNTARTGIINNISILKYFLPLRDDPKRSSIYNSILKIYTGARQIEETVQKQRLLHQRAANEISKIHENGEIARKFFEKKFANLTSLDECLKNDLHAIDKKLLESCLEIKKEMDNNQAKFPSSTTLITDEDFINLSYVLTSEVKIMLIETKPEDIKALLDEIDVAKKLAFDAKREKFLLEKGLKLFELEIENTIEVLKRLAEKRESIEAELKLLEKGKLENNEKKLEILKVCNDPNTINKKKEEHKNACKALRESFQEKLLQKVNEIDGEQKTLLNDIRNVKIVMRHLHLIFLIDESGSMEEKDNIDGKNHYETVIDCVKACVEKRKGKQVANDKYSVVKFDHRAEIPILNRSVKEGFGEISPMRKGATSFVEPLKKLAQILNENNFDAFIPVILFMSDGKGESKSTVLKQCQTVIKDFDNEDMLFFTVAFGKDADVDTLKEMSEAFNKGKPFISIGSQQILVFYRAENQNQLMEAFNVYEKFFDYQENLLETKRNLLTSHLAKQEKIFEQNLKIVEAIDKKNDEFLEANRLQDEKLADNLDAVSGRFEKRMETCRKLIGEIRSEENKIKTQKSEHETDKSHLEDTRKNIEEKSRIHNDNLESKLRAYDTCMKTLNEKRENAIKALKDDTSFNMVLESIAQLGVVIKEDQKEQFRIDYKSFIQDFNMFYQEVQELPKNSEAITLLFDRLFAVCEFIRKQQTTAINIATGEELTNKMWPLFCEYFFNNQSPSEAQDAEMLKELIMSKLPKQDANDQKIEEAFKMIFDYESVRRIFANIEESRGTRKNYVEGFVDEMIEAIDDAIGDLKNQIDELKENKENEDGKEEKADGKEEKADIDKRKEKQKQKDKKDQINKIKNEIKNSQAEKRQQKLKISQYRNQIRKILRCLEQMINEVREKYLDATLKKSLESSFKIFQITLNPQIDVLVDGFQASDRAAITSSAFNSNGSNFGKLGIKN